MSTLKDVKERYADGAKKQEAALCCPVSYDKKYLEIIPDEVIERDYGCGDPSRYVREGDTVVDLGSGGGKICFIASQIVGENGKVIGVDMTDDMLELARTNQPKVAEKIGYDNIVFKHGYIQDLKTDLDLVNEYTQNNPVKSATDYKHLNEHIEKIRRESPMIQDESVDIIVSNCVLNLVSDTEKLELFKEMFRVLKKGGRIAISDIVSDEVSPKHLKDDAYLWSGCISGALQEAEFVQLLEAVGFYGIKIDKYEEKPWQVVEGIEYRSITVTAYKGKEGPCIEKNQAVIYKGPWKSVEDDDGHVFQRGDRIAVCEKTYNIMTSKKGPYAQDTIGVPSGIEVQEDVEFDCMQSRIRDPQETKKGVQPKTYTNQTTCDGDGCC